MDLRMMNRIVRVSTSVLLDFVVVHRIPLCPHRASGIPPDKQLNSSPKPQLRLTPSSIRRHGEL